MKHWLNYSDLMVAFSSGVIRSCRWLHDSQLPLQFEERVNLFAKRVRTMFPPAISPAVGLIKVDLDHFRNMAKHFLRTQCADWGLPNGPNFDLDGVLLNVMQEIRSNIEQFRDHVKASDLETPMVPY